MADIPPTPTVSASAPMDPGAARPATVLGRFPSYAEAQRLVDHLSDRGFPVQHTRIVGTGLRLVEQVTGRVTTARAALGGVATGAWFGLFIGLLLGIFTDDSAWFGVLVTAVAIGAVWGAAFGFVSHWATKGRRDFASIQTMQAEEYRVEVDAAHAAEAERLGTG